MFQENGTLIFWKMKLLSPSSKNKKIHPEKISYIFSKESFSYTLGNGIPEKIPYISENGTFLYFFYISGNNFPNLKK